MADVSTPEARIAAAIERIEAAVDARARATDALARRHAKLRAHMEDAIGALDTVIARGGEAED